MDRKLIVVIAVTAATALVTWTVTKGADWIFDTARTTITSKTTRDRLNEIFTKRRRTIIGDVFWLLYSLSILIWFVHASPLVTSVGVVAIVLLIIFVIYFVVKLMWDVVAML